MPVRTVQCLIQLAEAHCRLRFDNRVLRPDAVAAIWICELGLTQVWGMGLAAPPKQHNVRSITDVSVHVKQK